MSPLPQQPARKEGAKSSCLLDFQFRGHGLNPVRPQDSVRSGSPRGDRALSCFGPRSIEGSAAFTETPVSALFTLQSATAEPSASNCGRTPSEWWTLLTPTRLASVRTVVALAHHSHTRPELPTARAVEDTPGSGRWWRCPRRRSKGPAPPPGSPSRTPPQKCPVTESSPPTVARCTRRHWFRGLTRSRRSWQPPTRPTC